MVRELVGSHYMVIGPILMNSVDRKRIRRLRREQKRKIKKHEECHEYDNFDKVFSFENLYKAYQNCRKGVSWKKSTQTFVTLAPLEISRLFEELHSEKWKSDGFYEFDLMERGKLRHIKSVTFRERVVQRCLCDNSLVPMLSRSFIYDNGATLKNKGYTFSMNRCKKHITDYYREHKSDGYVLTFDFSNYFESLNHSVLKYIVRKHYSDGRMIRIIEYLIDCFGDVGLGLGSQISQILALTAADPLDHYIKEVLRIEYYGRYMDDGYLIHESREYLKKCLEDIEMICTQLGIKLNEKKTRIAKLSSGFKFLKCRFILIPKDNKVIMKLNKKSTANMRRKLKKFKRFVDMGLMSYMDVFQSFQSWRDYASNFNSYKTIRNMENLYEDLFIHNAENCNGSI